jgi:hypothetical protein
MEASCSRVTQRGGVSDPILLPLASAPACLACTSPVDPSIHPSWRRPGHHLASYVHTYWHIASRHRRESLDPIRVSDRRARLHRSPAAAVAPRRATDVTGRFYVHERARAVMGFALCLYGRGRPHRARTVTCACRQVRCNTLLLACPFGVHPPSRETACSWTSQKLDTIWVRTSRF